MWIIPKNLDVSVCVRATVGLNWDLGLVSQLFAQCVMWRSKHSRWQTWLQRLKRASWMQHLSGRILKPSTAELFETEYTLSLAVIPVSHSQLPASDKAQTTPDTFGRILQESCRQLDLFGASLRMYPDTLSLDSPKFTEAYEIWVTQLRQDCLVRRKLAHHTDGNDCLSWPISRAADWKDGKQSKRFRGKAIVSGKLDEACKQSWPTPTARDPKGQDQPQRKGGQSLAHIIQKAGLLDQASPNTNGKSRELWPTPTAAEGAGQNDSAQALKKLGIIRSKLNPNWVEQLMGLPVGWTDLGSWATELCPSVQKKRSDTYCKNLTIKLKELENETAG